MARRDLPIPNASRSKHPPLKKTPLPKSTVSSFRLKINSSAKWKNFRTGTRSFR